MKTSYAIKQLAEALKDIRIARGFTQRELAERAGFGQNRLALIEAGEVDLRASTLIQLARALDLELVLVPLRVLPAVQSLTGGQPRRRENAGRHSVRGTPIRVLRHIQQHVAALERAYPAGERAQPAGEHAQPVGEHAQPASEELAKVKSAVQALVEMGPDLGVSALRPLRRSVHWLALARTNQAQAQHFLANATAELRALHQMLPAMARLEQAPQAQRAAYSLEDESS